MIEREYKFLIEKLPNDYDRKLDITQIYFKPTQKAFELLSIQPFKCSARIRIQTENLVTKYILNIKGNGEIERLEFEKEISELDANKLIENNIVAYLKKTRYIINKDGLCFEFDEYKEDLLGLLTCEVEISNLVISSELIKEKLEILFNIKSTDVSFDQKYKNTNLARKISQNENFTI